MEKLNLDAVANPHLAEVFVEGSVVYKGHFLHVEKDQVKLPDGRIVSREYIKHPGAVVILSF